MCRAETIFSRNPKYSIPIRFLNIFKLNFFPELWVCGSSYRNPLPCSCLTNPCLFKITNDSLFHREKSSLARKLSQWHFLDTNGLESGLVQELFPKLCSSGLPLPVQGSKLRGLQKWVTTHKYDLFPPGKNDHDLLWIYIHNLSVLFFALKISCQIQCQRSLSECPFGTH